MLEIDGSFGEGGGQILRTSLSLSCLSGKPFRIFNIRKARKRPGLMPQHLACVRASALISDAEVKGDKEGSAGLSFEPKGLRPGDYYFDIGTAGSTSMLIQTLLLPLIFAGGQSTVTLKGGTHVPWSPPFHYISSAFLPMLKRLGIDVRAEIESYGFYPKGGGKVRFSISPCKSLKGVQLTERGRVLSIKGFSGVSNLPLSIAQRQKDSLLKALCTLDILPDIETVEVNSIGQGSFVFLSVNSEGSYAGFSALGERGKRAEAVGEEAGGKLLDYYHSGACLDLNMADQLVPYLSLSRGTSELTASHLTSHLETNLSVTERFLGVRYEIEGEKGLQGRVRIKGADLGY